MSKNKKIIGIISIIIIIQLWFLYVTFSSPYLGIKVEEHAPDNWLVTGIEKNGIAEKDILPGDQILTIDSKVAEQNQILQKWHAIEQANSIRIQRGNEILDFEYKKATPRLYDLFPLIGGALCFLLAWIIGRKMFDSPSARMLAAVFLSGGIIYLSQGASIRCDPLGKTMIPTFMMILPVCFMQFLFTFFKEKSSIHLAPILFKIQWVLYSLIAVSVMYKPPYFFVSRWSYTIYKFDMSASLAFFTITLIGNLGFLSYLYLKYRHTENNLSSIIKTIWYSLFFSFLPITSLSLAPLIFNKSDLVDAIYTSWFLLFFPASFAYLIASDQLYDIGLVFRRFLFGCMLALVPSALLTGMFTFLFIQEIHKEQVFFLFFGSMLTLSLVLYFTEFLITRLEPVFFPRRTMLNTSLKKISKNLGTISTMRELKEIFLNDIVQTLEVRGGAIVFQSTDSTELLCAGEMDEAQVMELLSAGTLFYDDRYTCKEISHTEDTTSFLVMTRKRNNLLLNKEERHWLGLITSYLEVAMENVHLIRTLTNQLQDLSSKFSNTASVEEFQWFRKVMFELQEEERIRIASDLHDTTMQDLFFLKRRFASLMERFAVNPEEQQHLDNILKFVDLINASLRQSCFELNPHLLQEIGLVGTLQQYLDKESYTVPFHIHFEREHDIGRIEQESLVVKKHILRIVQELLNNAKKHSQASKVGFRLSVEGERFVLVYEDDGVGIDSAGQRTRMIGGSGIGMEQMKGRVMLLQGSMEVTNLPKAGTRISIFIPMHDVTEPKGGRPPHLRLV